jgi:hypothetical protein
MAARIGLDSADHSSITVCKSGSLVAGGCPTKTAGCTANAPPAAVLSPQVVAAASLEEVPPRGVEPLDKSQAKADRLASSGAVRLDSNALDPDLAVVLAAWPHLNNAQRKGILAVVQQATQDR